MSAKKAPPKRLPRSVDDRELIEIAMARGLTKSNPATARAWKTAYKAAAKSRRSFDQAIAGFIREHGYAPAPSLPFMPVIPRDLYRDVDKVEPKRLVPE